MSCTIYNLSIESDLAALRAMLDERRRVGQASDDQGIELKVRAILEEVRRDGLEAVLKYTSKFDAPNFAPNLFRVPPEMMHHAAGTVNRDDMRIIKEAAQNVRTFHQYEMQKAWFSDPHEGMAVGQVYTPIRRAGLYVPGGQGGETPLISSLVMTAVPAQVAGVHKIAVITPPRKDGTINPYILATAFHLGITEIYACGSAWGIAALAYGAGPLAPVDVIAGPGNIWVNTAKRLLLGEVGIDMVAGPSEIAIYADHTARPGWIAADMLAQAEHDPMASSLCVIIDKNLEAPIMSALKKQLADLPRTAQAGESLKKWGAIVHAANEDQAFALINELAPEHLELMCEHPWDVLPRVTAAGAIFVGENSAESLGDYYAGPNHVLPTMGTARFASGLGVSTFMRRSNVLCATPKIAQDAASSVARLARLEGLEAHARAAEIRLEGKGEEHPRLPNGKPGVR